MGLFALAQLPTLMALAALLLTIAILLRRSHRYLARQRKDRPPVRPAHAEPREQAACMDASGELLRWEVEMHETARALSGQLDSKMSTLEHLIREADRAAERLETALEARRAAARLGTDAAADPPPIPRSETVPETARPASGGTPASAVGATTSLSQPPDPLLAHPANQAEALKSAGSTGRASITRGISESGVRERARGRRPYEEIYLLADYGFDAAEIARRTSSPVGEVELILGLRAKR